MKGLCLMRPNIINDITDQYNSFTKSGKKLADYIFANQSSAQYMSITSLSENSGVGEATITRFCKSLGLSGYNDFKLALAKAGVSNNRDALSELGEDISGDDTLSNMCKKLYLADVSALNETLNLLNEDNVLKAVDYISKADHVFCFGQGGSNVMAKEAWARFATATNKFIHIEDAHMQAMASSICSENDIILFFSYSGATKDLLDTLAPAKKKGAKIILITHFSKSPASSYADIILLCGSNESPLQSGSVAAKIGQLFIIDYLFFAYCRSNAASCSKNLDATAQAISSKLL